MNHDTSHGKCGKTWKQRGNRTGHCGACHETFEGLTLFDWHQLINEDGSITCRTPASPEWEAKGLRLINGSWRGPELPADVLAAMRAR